MIAPAQADRTTIHNGTTSGLGTGSGEAVTDTSQLLIGFSSGSPTYGNFVILATVIVDNFTSFSDESWKQMKNYTPISWKSTRILPFLAFQLLI